MALKKDKKQVLTEHFDDERVKTFLNVLPRTGWDTDFLRLERAYRGMNEENFATFVKFFVEAGHNINATNQQGLTLLQVISQHKKAQDYCAPLKNAGCKN